MRYAIISDLHSNIYALKKVFEDIETQNIDKIICLGDIVGYGPHPSELVQMIKAKVDHSLMGNHDAVICGEMDSNLFNEVAQRVIHWTADQLSKDEIDYLKAMPYMIQGDNVLFSHGEVEIPSRFGYIMTAEDALASFNACEEQIIFVGHTHEAQIFLLEEDGSAHIMDATDFTLQANQRYIVNVGSSGLPRDGDWRSSYVIFDQAENEVEFKRIEYDFDSFHLKTLELDAMLEGVDVSELNQDDTVGNHIDFKPDYKKKYKRTAAVQMKIRMQKRQLQEQQQGQKKTVKLIAIIFAIAIALTIGISTLTDRTTPLSNQLQETSEPKSNPITVTAQKASYTPPVFAVKTNLMPKKEYISKITEKTPSKYWTVELADSTKQQVGFNSSGFVIKSKLGNDFTISGPKIRIPKGTKLGYKSTPTISSDCIGNVSIAVVNAKTGAELWKGCKKLVSLDSSKSQKAIGGKMPNTFELEIDTQVQFVIEGDFNGKLRLEYPYLAMLPPTRTIPLRFKEVTLLVKDSETFTHKFEGDGLPTSKGSDWIFKNSAEGSAESSRGSLLFSSDHTAGMSYFIQKGEDTSWGKKLNPETSWTLELRTKVAQGERKDARAASLAIWANSSIGSTAFLVIKHKGVSWGGSEARRESSKEFNKKNKKYNNSNDFHTYRITFHAKEKLFSVWRDGTLLSSEGLGTGLKRDRNQLLIGFPHQDISVETTIRYIRWDHTGAYAPPK